MKARRGRGEGSISVRKERKKDGTIVQRWVASAIIGSGKRKVVYASTKSDALQALRKLQGSDKAGLDFDSQRTRFADYATRWLEDSIRPSVQDAALRQYRGILKNHIVPVIGGLKMGDVKATVLRMLLADMERAGASQRLRQLTRVVLRAVFTQAVVEGVVANNPCLAIKPVHVDRTEMRYLNAEQVRSLLSAARNDRYYALYHLAIFTGMRQGEIFGLQWGDVDLDKGILTVRRSMQELDGVHKVKTPKTGLSRRIDLSASTVAALREHRRNAFGSHGPTDLVFYARARNGKRSAIRKSNFLRRSFYPLLAQARTQGPAFPAIRFHDLRHTCATLMLASGENVKVVSEMLGHKSPITTLRVYAHVMPGMQREAVNRFEGILVG